MTDLPTQSTMGAMRKKSEIQMFRKRLGRLLTFLPAVCMAFLIFSFSAQTGSESASLSGRITKVLVQAADRIAGAGWTEEEIRDRAGACEFYVRKAAHMTEYAVFAVSLLLPLRGCGLGGRRLYLTTFLICAGFAAGDEWHQSFVGGRGPSVRDVGIDCAGAGIGEGIAGLILESRKRRKNQARALE